MGYRPKRTPFELDFSGTEDDGLEITVRPLPHALMMDVAAACTTPDAATMRHVAATFTHAVETWNLEDDEGHPVPVDADGLLSQDSRFVNAVIQKWIESIAGRA